MSVMECQRRGCGNILCDKYSYEYGYICNSCFEEFVMVTEKRDYLDLGSFMESRKMTEKLHIDWREACDSLFNDGRN